MRNIEYLDAVKSSILSALTMHDTSQCIRKVMPFKKVDIDTRNSMFRLNLKLPVNTLLQPIATLHQYTKTEKCREILSRTWNVSDIYFSSIDISSVLSDYS
jgi:hypothetical protein